MEYITVREAAAKWGVTARQVQTLCKNGEVEGAVRFNRSFAIPRETPKPKDRRRRETTVDESRTAMPELDAGLFKKIFDHFPYRINICDADGIIVYINGAFTEGMLKGFGESLIGQYNTLMEENLDKWGLKTHIDKAFSGEAVLTPSVEFPNRTMVGRSYETEYAFVSLYEDINSFPLFDHAGNLKYVVTVFVPASRRVERMEVKRGREYIESHWNEPFNTSLAAKAANLSVSRFGRIFKEDAGFSPRDYYLTIKLNHIKEQLLDSNLSVSQAFDVCGVDYNSYYAMLFKKHAGMTPSQYKKANRKAL